MLAVLLAVMPALAHAPAWWEGRLLGPGDGAALHFPLKAMAWESLRNGELPTWAPGIFQGTPLLASYWPGALYPPTVLAALLPPFTAFQILVLVSLAAAAVLTFFYLRRLGAGRTGAYFSGLAFSLGPYLVGHLADSTTLVAAPTLPLLLLAAESHVNRGTPARAAGLAAALALLLLSGSPDAARAGAALLAGRLLVGHLFPVSGGPSLAASAGAVLAGLLLAAPQLLPTLLAVPDAGRTVTGLAPSAQTPLPGLTGLVLRYVSHTPAPALAAAALPLIATHTPIRVLGIALALCLGLQYGRGPLAAPGALALVFDFTLAVLAGLSLSEQWRARREVRGRRLRFYFLVASIAGAAALSVAAAVLGPLPETLAGSVGVLAFALILYFSLATSADAVKAGVWLLPLTVAFLLQPHGRLIWAGTPRAEELLGATPTREALDRMMGAQRGERQLTLAREWPEEALDLAWGNWSALAGRRTANGYNPMVPLRNRMALEGMGVQGLLPGAFFRTDPARLELLGVRWVQVPASALLAAPDAAGLGDTLDLVVEPGRPRRLPVPVVPATEIVVGSWLSNAVEVGDDVPVARVVALLASGREVPLVMRAGRDTAEWAYDRADVRGSVRHARPTILESWQDPAGSPGHKYLGRLELPGRYYVSGVEIEGLPGTGVLTLSRLAVHDSVGRRRVPVSLAAGYVSDTGRFREAVTSPSVRLFEVRHSPGPAWVVERLHRLPDDEAVLRALRAPTAQGIDARREALAIERETAAVALPADSRSSRARVVRRLGGEIDVLAEGPGLLVVAEGWDRGWVARVDGQPAPLHRVNHVAIGVVLPDGAHRVALRYRARGLDVGFALAGASGLALLARARLAKRRASRDPVTP
jgi:hypothetical protein